MVRRTQVHKLYQGHIDLQLLLSWQLIVHMCVLNVCDLCTSTYIMIDFTKSMEFFSVRENTYLSLLRTYLIY